MMKLQVAQAEDSFELKEFFKKFPLPGMVELKIDRQRDFFLPYSIQSDQYLTYLLRDEKTQSLEGLTSFIIRDVNLEGQERCVAFARDLRISQSRKAILSWGHHALPVMKEIQNSLGAEYFFTILGLNEAKALNTFLRSRDERRTLPRYYLYRRFFLVSLHGRFPWRVKPLTHLKIRRASTRTWDALSHYLVEKSRSKNLTSAHSLDSLSNQLERWRGLNLDDFLVAMDTNDNIVGCVAPWSSGGLQDFIPMHYNLRAHNFRQFLKFGRYFGWTRALTKPYSRLKVEAPLNFRYLCFLHADNEDIFEALLSAAYDEARENEFLVYLHMRSDFHLRRPLRWISAQSPYGLYAMVPPDVDPPEFLHPSQDRSVELEPFFVT